MYIDRGKYLVYLFSSLPYWGFSVVDYIKYLSNLNYP